MSIQAIKVYRKYLLVIFIRNDSFFRIKFVDKQFDFFGACFHVLVLAVGDGGEAGQVEALHRAGEGDQQQAGAPAQHCTHLQWTRV